MMKNIDRALFDIIHTYKAAGEVPSGHIELGLAENAVGLAPFRVLDLTQADQKKLDEYLEKAASEMK